MFLNVCIFWPLHLIYHLFIKIPSPNSQILSLSFPRWTLQPFPNKPQMECMDSCCPFHRWLTPRSYVDFCFNINCDISHIIFNTLPLSALRQIYQKLALLDDTQLFGPLPQPFLSPEERTDAGIFHQLNGGLWRRPLMGHRFPFGILFLVIRFIGATNRFHLICGEQSKELFNIAYFCNTSF